MDNGYIKTLKTPIAIIGIGKSGRSALELLKKSGFSPSQIIVFDSKDPSADCKTPEDLKELNPKTLVVSPGVALNQSWIKDLIAGGAHLTSEISLAASLITTEKIIGVTGSVGKSTVVSLLGTGAKSFTNAFVGGNLGTPFCDYALHLLEGKQKASWIILELSSYQLENCAGLNLDFSAITFLSSNHLERYESLDHYYQTKLSISEITKEVCILNLSSADCRIWAHKCKCEFQLVNSESRQQPGEPKSRLIGKHNQDNFAVAAELSVLAGWPPESIVAMAAFTGLPHRLEFVATLDGVTFINDSKATAMDSVLVAVEGCLENLKGDGRLHLLLGGKDKNLPWELLKNLKEHSQINFVFFGDCGRLVKEKTGFEGEYFEKLGSGINFCQKRSKQNDIVLLSPGGTSLDEFKNFEERGDFFKTLVLSAIEA